MTTQLIKKTPQNDVGQKLPPKLHLVTAAGQLSDPGQISDPIGVSSPKEATPSFSEMSESEKSPAHLQAIIDVELNRVGLLTTTKLRERYSKTYKNWDDMKQRCKANPQGGKPPITLDPSFEKFSDFLHISGPRPELRWSIDRIDPTGPYSADNCRWASKKTQARNKTNTVYMTYHGMSRPLVEWAEIKGFSPDLYRSRKRAGWSDEETINGSRMQKSHDGVALTGINLRNPFVYTPWPIEHRETLERAFQLFAHHGELRLKFMARYARLQMNALEDEIDDAYFPDDYDASIEEVGRDMLVQRKYKMWEGIFRLAQKSLSNSSIGQRNRVLIIPSWAEKELRGYA